MTSYSASASQLSEPQSTPGVLEQDPSLYDIKVSSDVCSADEGVEVQGGAVRGEMDVMGPPMVVTYRLQASTLMTISSCACNFLATYCWQCVTAIVPSLCRLRAVCKV